jgi:hypothetical protein
VLPEQGRSRAMPARSRASSRRHGAAPSSARTGHPRYQTLSASGGYSPALVATARVATPRPDRGHHLTQISPMPAMPH